MPALAQPDYARAEFVGGYSYLHTDESVGNSLPKGWAAGVTGNLSKNFGVEASFSGHYQNNRGFQARAAARFDKLAPWVHALFGNSLIRAHARSNTALGPADRRAADTHFAWAIGGGLDLDVKKDLAIRIMQADYVRNSSVRFLVSGVGGTFIQINATDSNNVRLSFGIVFRLGGD
jgi:hypothetical protein